MVLLTMVLTKYILIETFGFYQLSNARFLLLLVVILCITSGGYIINDIFDVATDKINKPNKTYIPVLFSQKKAFTYYWLLTIFGCLLSISFSIKLIHFVIFLGTPILLYIYSAYLKKLPLIGNIVISLLVSLPIYTVYLVDFIPVNLNTSPYNKPTFNLVLFYCAFAFLTTIIREIIKDIEDINGDLKIKATTLPILFGRKRASKVAFFFSAILLLFLLIVLQFLQNETLFLIYGVVFLLFPLLYFMYKLWISKSKKEYAALSNLMKGIMLFGILSMILFKFI